ncbi:MAG TPA: acyl-ACP--UDP-N-acetylglucosamine O-acyltransferase [Tepidisphaeraceae bacterium]|jgi:UDP-N-acetylglucosamine acyltransferase|nr:acyl-ACP--UDP-N-acetylglucosamine O-acyltransferase [Tepidisphaeraceae bacterium]
MPKISPFSQIDPQAKLASDVEVGPFCVIGPNVTVGAGCKLMSHVVLTGHTTIGERNTFHPHSVIGGPPQDLKYSGEPTRLEIGNDNVFRECVTVNTGTVQGGKIFGGSVTRVGSNNLLMVNAHLGHDVQLGSKCIIANNVMLAGHIVVGNNVVMNGLAGVNAFVSIGDFAYLAGAARIHLDVPPFVKVSDNDQVRALNTIGLKRGGFIESDIDALEDAARKLFFGREKPFSVVLGEFNTMNGINPHVKTLIEFLHRRNLGKHGRYLESLRK